MALNLNLHGGVCFSAISGCLTLSVVTLVLDPSDKLHGPTVLPGVQVNENNHKYNKHKDHSGLQSDCSGPDGRQHVELTTKAHRHQAASQGWHCKVLDTTSGPEGPLSVGPTCKMAQHPSHVGVYCCTPEAAPEGSPCPPAP